MTLRIAMWSGPRNISTALMRSWENRADCSVLDEPLYAAFLARTGLEHPGRISILKSQPTNWEEALARLTAPCSTPIQYQKHMSHHVPNDADLDWMADLQHVFLIRDPAEVLASYVIRRSAVTPEDLGFLQQLRLIEHLQRLNQTVTVLDSADLLQNPERRLTQLCRLLGVPFDDAMLTWPAGPRDSDGVWARYWYDAVEASTGFAPYRPRNPSISAVYQPVLDTLLPTWHQLKAMALPPA